MGIQVEFNPDLALRQYTEFTNGNRKKEECVPMELKVGQVYEFLKTGQRNYRLHGQIPLLITKGDENLSRPIASIIILNATHLIIKNKVYTEGQYKVIEVFGDNDIHFESYKKI